MIQTMTCNVRMQEEGQAAVLCLACGREATGAPERILVARIGARQAGDHQAIQVRVLPGTAMSASAVREDLPVCATAALSPSDNPVMVEHLLA